MRTSSQLTLALAGAGALLLGATACGSGSPSASGTTPQSYGGNGSPQNKSGGGAAPGADGKVAAVTGSTAQVQSAMSGQVAVSWTSATTFTKQVAANRAGVKAGVCVTVEPTGTSTGDSGDQTEAPTAVTAAKVRISAKTNGSCTPVFRGGGPQVQQGGPGSGGDGPQLQGEGPGAAAPGGAAPGGAAPGEMRLRGAGAIGEVSGVTANGFTVAVTRPTGNGSAAKTSTVAVTVTSATTYTTTAAGSASDVKVGVCVRADGTTDSTGAITAKTIAVTPPVDGQCGGMVFRRDGAPGSGSGSGTTSSATRES